MEEDTIEMVSKIETSMECVSELGNTVNVYSKASTLMELVSEVSLEEVS